MVRVISAHHFAAQDVAACPAAQCSIVAEGCLLLATDLHQVEVRDLVTSSPQLSHVMHTVDMVAEMAYSPVGRYVATREVGSNSAAAVRVYINWRNPAACLHPMRARIAGRVTPGWIGEEAAYLEMVELGSLAGGVSPLTALSVCPSTGNLLVADAASQLSIFRYVLAGGSSSTPRPAKFIDFEEYLRIQVNYVPVEVSIVEDFVACLTNQLVHIFKVKLEDQHQQQDDGASASLSLYSLSSESSSMDFSPDKTTGPPPPSDKQQADAGGSGNSSPWVLRNVTERRRTESSCERENAHPVRRHPNHITIDLNSDDAQCSIPIILNPLVEKLEREMADFSSSPNIFEESLGPCDSPPFIQVSVSVTACGGAVERGALEGRSREGVAVTLVSARLNREERARDRFRLLRMEPVYWREFRVKKNREATLNSHSNSSQQHSPLQSVMYSHLMSLTLAFTTTHEGYLYHIPGHIRRAGKGVGVQRIATYPFTSPVIDLGLEPCLLHALTETGLETYCLRSGYFTVREAEVVDNMRLTCPAPDSPICLIGLRPFIGARRLLVSSSRLVLLAAPDPSLLQPGAGDDWTLYSLHLPTPLIVFRDMLTVADINAGVPHGHLQLLSEAHVLIRTWLHRLTWQQVLKPVGVTVGQEEVDAARQAYQLSCLRLADHFLRSKDRSAYRLAVPYYRMSQLHPLAVLDRMEVSSAPLRPGVLYYIEELVSQQDSILESAVADRVIGILGTGSLSTLVNLILTNPTFRSFKSKLSLEFIESQLRDINKEFQTRADLALAAVLIGGTGDWLSLVPPVHLAHLLLKHHHLLFEQSDGGGGFSELALVLRNYVPVIFVEVCVSLIESEIQSLGELLQLLLRFVMFSSSCENGSSCSKLDNAALLQLFLETYFVELLSSSSSSSPKSADKLSGDQQQGLHTLVRSYLAGILHPAPRPILEDSALPPEPGEMYGARPDYLDLVPPFNTADFGSPEQEDGGICSLLKLQSLLSSPLCDLISRDIVTRFVGEHSDVRGALSLSVLSAGDAAAAVRSLSAAAPAAVPPYCKHKGAEKSGDVWQAAVQALHEEKSQEAGVALASLVEDMVKIFPPDQLTQMLPPEDKFDEYIMHCRRIHQAERLQGLIVATGQRLLTPLSL